MNRLRWLGGLLLGFLVLVGFTQKNDGPASEQSTTTTNSSIGLAPDVNAEVWKHVEGKQTQCRAQVDKFVREEAVDKLEQKDGELWVAIEEAAWNILTYDDKVAVALTMYCAYTPPNGKFTVTIWDARTSKIIGTLTDGNYWS